MMSDHHNEELKKSIKTLIGLDLIDRLKADLTVYKTRSFKKNSEDKLVDEIKDYEKELTLISSNIESLKDKKSDLKNKLLKTKTGIADYEKKINAQGGKLFELRDKLIVKKTSLEKEIEDLTFIGRMVQHIFPKGFKRIRYYGVQATKTFEKVKVAIQKALSRIKQVVKDAIKIIPQKNYRERYKESTGKDPFKCKKCGEEMDVYKIWHPKYGVDAKSKGLITWAVNDAAPFYIKSGPGERKKVWGFNPGTDYATHA